MMYSNRFVVAVKVNGQVLRESGDTVHIPFGSEYSVLLKNLNSVRASVNVSIDGSDVAGELVVRPNSFIDLERYIRNGNLEAGNRFKFIARSAEIESHRGIKAEDGLIRVEYRFERPVVKAPDRMASCGMLFRSESSDRGSDFAPVRESTGEPIVEEVGITVPGSESNQKFVKVPWFPTEDHSEVIVLRLIGRVGEVLISAPITVSAKLSCQTCGKSNKPSSKYCSGCGTALTLI